MKQRIPVRLLIFASLAVLAYFQKDRISGEPPREGAEQVQERRETVDREGGKGTNGVIVRDVSVRDLDGSVKFRGDVDLGPTLGRIKGGKRDPHENDGEVFGNRERKLPQKPRGYYREYVVRTPGIRHAGPQRLVIGQGGEVYYTHDHYNTFTRIQR